MPPAWWRAAAAARTGLVPAGETSRGRRHAGCGILDGAQYRPAGKAEVNMALETAFTERALQLLPALRERAPQAEQLRMLPAETVAQFQDAELFRALQPKRYGGLELDPAAFFDAVASVGTACASSAWVLSVLGVHSWHLGLFDPQAQQDVWGEDPRALVCSSYGATGQVTSVDGGYRLTGTWPFSSGSDHSQWAFLGGVVPTGPHRSAPVGDDGREWPDVRTFLVPMAECTLDDNWFVAGLSGSGSKQVRVQDVFVPEYRTHRFLDIRSGGSPGLRENASPLYRLPFGSLFCYAIAAPVIGTARGMYQALVAEGRERAQAAYERGLPEDVALQLRIGHIAAELDGVTLQLRENFATMTSAIERGEVIGMGARSRCRWDAARAAQVATACVDRVFESAGGRAIFLSNPMQRAFRDAHAMRAHAYNNPDHAARVMAREELGFPNRELLI
jgi:3-hydroxy-9,10-secoandrosta-1,3,5(10)-triene-9,17-dione monooxygenase